MPTMLKRSPQNPQLSRNSIRLNNVLSSSFLCCLQRLSTRRETALFLACTDYRDCEITYITMAEPPSLSLPNDFILSRLLLVLDLDAAELVCCVSTFQSNLYIGTSTGNLLHYLLFDDADDYMLILKVPVNPGEQHSVQKMLVLPDALLCLALANRVIHPFSLPELSPCHIGKVKDASEMSELTQVDNPKVKNKHDKIIVYTTSKIRVVQFLPDRIKLLRDINYSGAIVGYSSAAGSLANYSNICLVANSKNYDVVDLQLTRRIFLFDYNIELVQNVKPHIVPYSARDKPNSQEEYMLTVSSDASDSMAMFINVFGEVTRGTLTWLENGYPTNGIAIEWPFVFGLFTTPLKEQVNLIFSSLESLDIAFSQDLQLAEFGVTTPDELQILDLKSELKVVNKKLLDLFSPVDAHGKTVTVGQKHYFTTRSVLLADRTFFFLHRDENLITVYDRLTTSVEETENASGLADLISEVESVLNFKQFTDTISLLLLLTMGKGPESKKLFLEIGSNYDRFDPRLCLLLYDDCSFDLGDDFIVEDGLLRLTKKLRKFSPKKDLRTWMIDEVYSNRKRFPHAIWQYFRTLRFKMCKTAPAAISLIDQERGEWLDELYKNDEIIKYFKAENMNLSLLHLYKIEQEKSINENGKEIIDLALELLRSENIQELLIELGQTEKDLIKLVFFQIMSITDADEYNKKLLELLKLRSDEGLELLRENKGGRHKATHHHILKELSKTHSLNSNFLSLKIEYIELNFMEIIEEKRAVDYELLEELLAELLQYLSSDTALIEVEMANLEILISTFKIDSNIGGWPKLSLVDFLHVHSARSECKELAMAYLKIYELLVVKSLHEGDNFTWPGLEQKAFAYLQNGFSTEKVEDLICYMLEEEHDYCVAEQLCIYPAMPLPRKLVYFEAIRSDFAEQLPYDRPRVAENLKRVISYYLQMEDSKFRFTAVSHVVDSFGDAYFTMEELLDVLPDDMPLSYVYQYFSRNVVQLEKQKYFASTVKTMTKLDAKFTQEVAMDFERTYGLLEKK